jgi:hypothetical protein
MNHGCNITLNVFQPTLPLYYNNSVCQEIKTGSGIVFIHIPCNILRLRYSFNIAD